MTSSITNVGLKGPKEMGSHMTIPPHTSISLRSLQRQCCDRYSTMWFDKKKRHCHPKEEMEKWELEQTPELVAIFAVLCFCLVIRGRRPNQSTLCVARFFYPQEWKTKQVLIHFNFIPVLPVDICAYGLGNYNTRLVLSNNFLLIIPLTVWRKGS